VGALSLEHAPVPDAPAAVVVPLKLTAIALLLRPMGDWYVRPIVLALAMVALISTRTLVRPALWWIVTGLVAIRIAADWPLADNHIYLLGYWTLAIALSIEAPDAAATLSASSRWLIGSAFTFAVLWKAVLAPDFLDGRFFRVTLMTDPRFADAAVLVGGLTSDELRDNRAALAPLPEGAELLSPRPIAEPPRLRLLAAASTWGILVLEALVAVAMLAPGRLPEVMRHAALLIFCLVTYAFAPVAGFGWLLVTMGLAQCGSERRALRACYVGMFLLVLFYSEVPWASLLARG
jgi:hypothetical protein